MSSLVLRSQRGLPCPDDRKNTAIITGINKGNAKRKTYQSMALFTTAAEVATARLQLQRSKHKLGSVGLKRTVV
jgi:hypothetical protein